MAIKITGTGCYIPENVTSNRDFLEHEFFQAEDGIRDRLRSRGLGDVYKRQTKESLDEQRMSLSSTADHLRKRALK